MNVGIMKDFKGCLQIRLSIITAGIPLIIEIK